MSSTNGSLEKQAAPSSGKKKGFFARRPKPEPQPENEKQADVEVPAEDAKPKVEDIKPVSFTDLFRLHTRTELVLNLIGLVCAAGAGAAQPLMSLLFGNLTQDFVSFETILAEANSGNATAKAAFPAARSHFRHTAANDASYLVYIGVAMFVATYVYMVVWVYTGEVNAKRIRERYLQAVLRQDIAYFDNVGAGEVATRIQTDTHLVQQGISEKVALVIMFIAAFFTGFILAYVRNWRLALALTSIIPCIAIMGGTMNRFVSKYMQLSLKHVAEGGTVAEEVISTVRTAQAFGTQSILSGIYDKHVDNARTVDMKAAGWQGGGLAVFFFIIYSSYALAFDFGTTLINEHHANAGQVVNVFFAILIGSFSLALLAPEMQAITHARGAAAKLYATIDRIPPIDSADPGGLKPENVVGEIVLEHVYFNYPSRPNVPIVKDLNLTFPAGKTCALVGASGSGKSTCIGLIERFYDPLSGFVKLDGVDLKELNLKWLRSQIGLVSQEPTLFATTIKGNVAHGLIGTKHEHASQEEKDQLIKEACIKANADGFITKLPLGYDTMVGERGFLLSGGQKQRIAIARAIVSDPKILLLDEATSALDTQSEGIVQNALDKAAEGRTTITIAHRLSTIKDADCIYVMGGGVVLEKGTHQELLKNEDGAYSRLVAAQKLREAREAEKDVTGDGESSTIEGDKEKTMEQQAAEEIPLGRKQSGRSLGSELIEQRQKEKAGSEHKDDYSLPYLFKRMGIINREGWKWYGLGFIAACCTGAVYPAFGIVFAQAISNFSNPNPHIRRERGDRDALWFFVIAILSTFAVGFQNYLFASTAASLTAKLRSLSFKAILRQDIEFFDKDENSTGALTSSLSDNPQKVNGLAGVTLGAIVQAFATLVVGLILGLIFAWKLGLVGLACMPLLVSAGYIRLRVVVLKDQKNKRAHEDSAQLACEAAGAIRTVASLTREQDCTDLYSQSLQGPLEESNRSAIWSNLLFALSQSMSFYVIALTFWYGSRLVSELEFSTTDFFIGLTSTVFGAIQAGNVFSFVPDMSSAKGAGSDIIRLLDSRPEIDAESTEGNVPKDVQGRIRFEDIHFRYPTRPGVRVLRGLNLTVEPGTYVALVGASGCGKSTTIQLVERFYDPLAGHVYLDGQDIAELNVQEYRKHIALVSQEPTLYAGTVRFNILLGATKPHAEVTQEEIEQACRNANILDFIQSLPDGFDTEVGGKGSQLSGGQKQRIAIARALLRNPKVLLLDEATSALDSQSEKVVQAALDQAAKGRTTIAIAHRLSTIQNADCIYFIKEGTVSEYGTHDQLLAKKGDYYEYVQLQTLSKAA
ncbi:P-loop containing nucleoside triphosphate hydrolase protein [Punctularia strigosozonata HHB-11173 SS5]|uniref:P-loop containing nucleoside triphosphate hydrolase protein n=1 Tax=Punctularia strigosozonata (strain HHB-11173) TaxID=741275 RepID=UPI00044163EC|nr:P-loop containing nucleoside triphosphate hydrolase protein [Punctularia strigosozonata HHB-11173 SS5]EIN12733.1 P-loop containing nucleoside triphosphate hydrolase protein [Punctularia strigosozonata HHB-11173 SS5]